MFCAIWYHSYNLKNVKNTHGGALILVKLQAEACNSVAKYGLKSSCVLLNESFLWTEFFSEIPARSCQISKNYHKKIHKIYEIFLEL